MPEKASSGSNSKNSWLNSNLLTEDCEPWKFLGVDGDKCISCVIGAEPEKWCSEFELYISYTWAIISFKKCIKIQLRAKQTALSVKKH